MKFKTMLLVTTAGLIGYVLGAKAGRGRYRELRNQAEKAWNAPAMKKARKRAEKELKKATRKFRG